MATRIVPRDDGKTTHGPKQLPRKETVESVRKKCLSNPFWCAWYLCGYRKISIVLHFAICLWLLRGLKAGKDNFLILVPRGHCKTSLLQHAFAVWLIINNPNVKILIVMHSLDEGRKKARKLKAIILGKAMRAYFPELIPARNRDQVWSATEFVVNRTEEHSEATVTYAGVKTGLTGGHYDWIILDDGIDLKAVNEPGTMENAKGFLEALPPLMEDEGSGLLGLGTLWPGGPEGYYETWLGWEDCEKLVLGARCDDRFYAWLDDLGVELPVDDREYIEERLKPANREQPWAPGTPIFPEERTDLGLKKIARIMGPFKYAHQMNNILITEGAALQFERRHFQPYELRRDPNSFQPQSVVIDGVAFPYRMGLVTVALDPTGGLNKKSDFAGITAMWWLKSHRIAALLDFWHEKGPAPHIQISAFLDMADRWNADLLIPEAGSMQVWVGAWLQDEMVRRGVMYRWEGFNPGTAGKGARLIQRFHPYCEAKQVFVRYPEHEEVVKHMVELNITPGGEIIGASPALADTFPMHCDHWTPGEIEEEEPFGRIRDDDQEERQAINYGVRYGLRRRMRVIR